MLLQKNSIREAAPVDVASISPTVDPTIVPSIAGVSIVPSGEQKDCPNGFYYYENKDFSICYPNTMIVKPSYHIQNANATETDVTGMFNSKRYITILPIFYSVGGPSKCISRSQITVSGLPATRELNTTITADTCGPLIGVATSIVRKDGHYFYLTEDSKDKGGIDLDEYKTIEFSLRIK